MIRVELSDLAGLSSEQRASLLQRRIVANTEDWAPRARLPTIAPLDEMLPAGIPRGAVVTYTGVLSPLLGILAAAAAADVATAVVNLPARRDCRVSLLAVHEMDGAALRRVAHIDAPQARVVETVHILLDGLGLVVADLGAAALPPSTAKILLARAHQRECTLILAGRAPQITGVDLRITARCVATEGLGLGTGRLRAQTYTLQATPRGGRTVTATLTKGPQSGGMRWSTATPTATITTLTAAG